MNDLVREHLETHGYQAVLKHIPKYRDSKRQLAMFMKFKRHKSAKMKSNLSFEVSIALLYNFLTFNCKVNFDEDETLMSRVMKQKEVIKSITKTKKPAKKKEISKEFIAHIVKLGFDGKDAWRLYETKGDWLGMNSGGRVLCTEKGCSFSTPLSGDALFEHCRTAHAWRDYPCSLDNCAYVAFSPYSHKQHMNQFHSPYRTTDNQPGMRMTL